MKYSSGLITAVFFLILSWSVLISANAEIITAPVPGPSPLEKEKNQLGTYRCWVKVPDHWTNASGRDLWVESVTFTIEKLAESHELWINGKKIGSAGKLSEEKFESGFKGTHRYKVPPGLLVKGHWNEIYIRNFSLSGKSGFLGSAPSIQGYFLECVFGNVFLAMCFV